MLFAELTSRGVIAIGGDERAAFLNNLITCDIADGAPHYAALLSPQGKFLHDFFVLATPTELLIDCEKERQADLLQRLSRYKLRSAVTLYDASEHHALVAIQGNAVISSPAAHVFNDPRHDGMWQRAFVARDWLPDLKARCFAAGYNEGNENDYHHLRIALGIPEGSADMEPERAFPMDYGLDRLNAISFDKGCYIGQELTARMKYRGLVKKQVFTLSGTQPWPAAGTPVMAGTQEAGELRSHNSNLALALLRLEFKDQPLACNGQPVTLQP